MLFDIIDIPEEEFAKLNVKQMKLLRAAQRNKDELVRKAQSEVEQFRLKILSAGMKRSSLLEDKKKEIDSEVNYRCAVLADDLIYNMSVCKTTTNGGSSGGGGSDSETGYLVDYSLSYSERYVIVRNYYLAIKDVDVRMKKYAADEVAKKYLGSYYGTLYNVLATYDK